MFRGDESPRGVGGGERMPLSHFIFPLWAPDLDKPAAPARAKFSFTLKGLNVLQSQIFCENRGIIGFPSEKIFFWGGGKKFFLMMLYAGISS